MCRNIQAIPQSNGTFLLNRKPSSRIPFVQVNAIYPDPDGETTWFASADGLMGYDTNLEKNHHLPFQALIREVVVNGMPLVYDAEELKYKDSTGDYGKDNFPVFPYKDRNLRFEFAAPFFEGETETMYQYFLKGYDNDWSAWTKETKKDYTNLGSGLHVFRVRARNIYGKISSEAAFQFKVLPPWYLAWWAFSVYAAAALLIMYLVVKWRSWKLELEKQKLEHIINERTEKINRQNLQLQEQAKQLKELNEVKSNFFANISHEFRTPLTLIMGPLEQILSGKPDKEMETKANLMLRNSRRLLNLINQLLDLAKFESGKMQLEALQQDIVPFLKNIVMCFQSLATQNEVSLSFHGQEDNIDIYLDPGKIETIITNLLANAFNCLSSGGRITVSVRRGGATGIFPAGCVEISVRDTGPGIPKDQLPHIFDRFYRGTGSQGADRKGSGIGLALSKDLVELHHGEIQVKSSCPDDHTRGTEFIIRLPTGKNHLQPGEIVDEGDTGQSTVFKEPSEPSPGIKLNKSFCGGAQGGFSARLFQKAPPLVLVVEDNPIERLFIKVTLEDQFNVIEAADGKEGILRAKEIIPDLIVSDIIMPVLDGYELCRTLKQDVLTSHIPIVLLTAKGSEESVLQGLEAGADDYITKPFSKSLLAARAGNLLELRRQLQLERKNRMTLQPEKITVSPIDDEFYKKLQDTVETHLSDPDFNVEALSRVLMMSQATLYRKIHALTGQNPTSFIRTYRIKRAAQLLKAKAGNVTGVADKVGFLDKSYFARCFKEQFHCSPSDIRSSGVSGPINEDTESREESNEHNRRVNSRELSDVRQFDAFPAGTVHLKKPSVGSKGLIGPPCHGAPGRGQEIILLVEDNDDARHYIRESLEPGYRVVEAADGGEGIARAVEVVPDLVISDIMMPEVDGYELCRVLKKDVCTSHIPVVLLTAKVSEESIIRGLETGADDYITKPFNTKILQTRIKNLIGLRSHLQKSRNREMALLPGKISESKIDREFMKELNAVIEKNLSDPEFNVDRLAKKLYVSRNTLHKKILAITGETPTEFIRWHRLKRGAQLLGSNFGSVLEVAFEVGFSSSSYFAKCFKEMFHRSPTDYQVSKAK
jgi:DNA-binding response OmpR family regulator/signal transduction histidine kinase